MSCLLEFWSKTKARATCKIAVHHMTVVTVTVTVLNRLGLWTNAQVNDDHFQL